MVLGVIGSVAFGPAPLAHGDPPRIERIEIRGNTRTRDNKIRRTLALVEGEHIAPLDLVRARARLLALGGFTWVSITVRPGAQRGDVRVEIDVRQPTAPTSGFSSTENFIAQVQMSQRPVGAGVP